MVVAERLLEHGELVSVREAFDGLDRRAVGLDGEHHAALDERSVDDDGAGAAVSGVAADVAAREVDVVAEEMDEQLARLHVPLVLRAVDRDGDVLRGRHRCRFVRHSAPL